MMEVCRSLARPISECALGQQLAEAGVLSEWMDIGGRMLEDGIEE
jgi:hypothetical protein